MFMTSGAEDQPRTSQGTMLAGAPLMLLPQCLRLKVKLEVGSSSILHLTLLVIHIRHYANYLQDVPEVP